MTVPLADIRLVVFDLDGTLVDAFEDIQHAVNYALIRLGRGPRDLQTIRSYVGNGVRNLMTRALDTNDPFWIDRGVDLWREYSGQYPALYARLYPGAIALLRSLGSLGVRRAVLSNKVQDIAVRVTKELGAAPHLDAIWGERPEFGIKPDPAALESMMDQFDSPPDLTLVVGDGEPDIRVAQAAGAWSCGASWGLNPRRLLDQFGADMVVDSMSELRQAFEQAAGKPDQP